MWYWTAPRPLLHPYATIGMVLLKQADLDAKALVLLLQAHFDNPDGAFEVKKADAPS